VGLIFLTGMPGSGKTTVGALLAREMHYRFVDLDEDIERRAGKTIPRIFAEEGESSFREYESETLSQACRLTDAVVALGAGALERDENFKQVMAHGIVIYLRADLDTLIKRYRSLSSRPLLADVGNDDERRARLTALLERREAKYLAAQINVEEIPGQSAAELTSKILQALSSHAAR
jgi:shikimate kinase